MHKILLVDDELNILNALRRTIAQEFPSNRLAIELCTDPLAALSRCREVRFDIVISDFRMPSINGIEFLRAIKDVSPNSRRLSNSPWLFTMWQSMNTIWRTSSALWRVNLRRKNWKRCASNTKSLVSRMSIGDLTAKSSFDVIRMCDSP